MASPPLATARLVQGVVPLDPIKGRLVPSPICLRPGRWCSAGTRTVSSALRGRLRPGRQERLRGACVLDAGGGDPTSSIKGEESCC